VSRRTSSTTRMEGRRVSLTPGATMCFGSLGFVYTRRTKPVTGRTFARPTRPNDLTGAAGRTAFVRGFSGETIMAMLGPSPTQECFRIAVYYLTDLTFQASGAKPLAWGSSWSGTPPCTPTDNRASRTTR
jgi:hypothetical protein